MALETEPIRIRGSTRATATAWWMRRDPPQPLPRPSCSRYESVNDRWSGSLLGRVPTGFEPAPPPCPRRQRAACLGTPPVVPPTGFEPAPPPCPRRQRAACLGTPPVVPPTGFEPAPPPCPRRQ